MSKKLFKFYMFPILLMILSACKLSDVAIEKAISQTEMVKSTNISAAKITSTITPITTPRDTSTPAPIFTPTLSPTSKPEISLSELVISIDDIYAILPGAFVTEMVEVDIGLSDSGGVVDAYSGYFSGQGIYEGLLIFLQDHRTSGSCDIKNQFIMEENKDNIIPLPESIKLPENSFGFELDESNTVVISFCQSEILTYVSFIGPAGWQEEDTMFYTSVYAQKQYKKLESAGY